MRQAVGMAVLAASLVGCDGGGGAGTATTAASTSTAAKAPPTQAAATATAATPSDATGAAAVPASAEVASPAAPPPAATPLVEEVRPGCGPLDAIPAIPAGTSPPPSSAEWANACHVNNQGGNTHAKNCVMKVLREWLQLTCVGDMTGYEKLEGLSKQGAEYFEFHRERSLASIVVRLKKSGYLKGRFCRAGDRASVFYNWPADKDRPSYIAMSAGSACTEPSWTTPP